MKITKHCATRFAERAMGLGGDQVEEAARDQAKADTIQRLAQAAARRALQAKTARSSAGYVLCVDPESRVAFVINPRGDTAVTCYVASQGQARRIGRQAA